MLLDGAGVTCRPGDVTRWLHEAVRITGLTPFDELIREDKGQGIILIAESHVCIEVRGARASADIFSCTRLGWWQRLQALRLSRRVFGGEWTARMLRRSVPGQVADRSDPAS